MVVIARQAVLAGVGIPLPIPDMLGNFASTTNLDIPYLDSMSEFLAEEVSKSLDDAVKQQFAGLASALDDQRGVDTFTVDQSRRLTSQSYEALHALLAEQEKVKNPTASWRPSHTGLVFAGPAVDGTSAWVSEGAVATFMEKGKQALRI